jgi:hypothetical protein
MAFRVVGTIVFVASASLWGCADGGPRTRGGDGGRRDGGPTLDAGPDAIDASLSEFDAASPGEVDAGRDAGPPARDAGASDAGRCAEGTTMSCTTACGSVGSSRCVGGMWSACIPPPERCNGGDDDCDGLPDDGFDCRAGATGTCTTSCGSVGTRSCTASCTWGPCSPPAETCNGSDDDCDGQVDEGFRATVLEVRYSTDLRSRHPGCDGTSQRIGPDCNAAIHRSCAARGCTPSGYGPVENTGDSAFITCVVGTVVSTTYSALSTHHSGCTASTRYGPDCNAAIHRYCRAIGQTTGFGPVENWDDNAVVTCVRSATVMGTTYTAMRTYHSGCDGMRERMGPNCNAAIHRYCRALGFDSGWGPLENYADNLDIACIRR